MRHAGRAQPARRGGAAAAGRAAPRLARGARRLRLARAAAVVVGLAVVLVAVVRGRPRADRDAGPAAPSVRVGVGDGDVDPGVRRRRAGPSSTSWSRLARPDQPPMYALVSFTGYLTPDQLAAGARRAAVQVTNVFMRGCRCRAADRDRPAAGATGCPDDARPRHGRDRRPKRRTSPTTAAVRGSPATRPTTRRLRPRTGRARSRRPRRPAYRARLRLRVRRCRVRRRRPRWRSWPAGRACGRSSRPGCRPARTARCSWPPLPEQHDAGVRRSPRRTGPPGPRRASR